MTSVVIVAAGRGTRMGPNVDKLFLEVAGAPVVVHTWKRFEQSPSIDEIVMVVRDGMQSAFTELAVEHGFRKPYRLVPGGKERQDSVWNGLSAIHPEAEVVAVHDGARPCASEELIAACVAVAREHGAAVAAQRVTDTIKESQDGATIAAHLERSRLWAVQTPQTFRVEIIRRALSEVRAKGLLVTDDTAACAEIGQPVRLVESRQPNPKVTTPSDLPVIDLLLASKAA